MPTASSPGSLGVGGQGPFSPAGLQGALGEERAGPSPRHGLGPGAGLSQGRKGQERDLQHPRLLSRHLGSAEQSQGVATAHLRPVTEQPVPPAPGRG